LPPSPAVTVIGLYAFKSSVAPAGFPYFTGREAHEMLMYRPRFRHPERAAKPVNLTAAEKISAILNFVAAELDDLALDVETPSGEVSAIDSPVLLGLPAQQAGNGHSLTLLRAPLGRSSRGPPQWRRPTNP